MMPDSLSRGVPNVYPRVRTPPVPPATGTTARPGRALPSDPTERLRRAYGSEGPGDEPDRAICQTVDQVVWPRARAARLVVAPSARISAHTRTSAGHQFPVTFPIASTMNPPITLMRTRSRAVVVSPSVGSHTPGMPVSCQSRSRRGWPFHRALIARSPLTGTSRRSPQGRSCCGIRSQTSGAARVGWAYKADIGGSSPSAPTQLGQ